MTTMQALGNTFDVDNNLMVGLERFVCRLYRRSDVDRVNEARYRLFCSSAGSETSMPPCQDSLSQHAKRANYQAAIWKQASQPMITAPDPVEHGWLLENEQLSVWSSRPSRCAAKFLL